MKPDAPFEAIGPTAHLIAWLRAAADLPYARAVSDAIGGAEVAARLLADSGVPTERHLSNAPFAEARYRAVESLVEREGFRRVLELGAGFTLRSLAMTARAELDYVDSDLPALQAVKADLLSRMPALQVPAPAGRLHLVTADATAPAEVAAAAARLPSGPLAVVHEGLMGYLDFEEKGRVGQAVSALLSRHGGAWITPDFATREDYARHDRATTDTPRGHASVQAHTGRDFLANAFDDDAHVETFAAGLGLRAEVRPQLDGSFTLRAPGLLGLDEERIRAAGPRIWVLRPR